MDKWNLVRDDGENHISPIFTHRRKRWLVFSILEMVKGLSIVNLFL